MHDDYRTINDVRSNGNSSSGGYAPGTYTDSAMNDIRHEQKAIEHRAKHTTCFRCGKMRKRRYINQELIPGLMIHDFKFMQCSEYLGTDPEKDIYPKLNCGKGKALPKEDQKSCNTCMHAVKAEEFEVSREKRMKTIIQLYKCKYDREDTWCRNYYNCVRYKRKGT